MFKHFEDDVEMYGMLVYNEAGEVVDTYGSTTLWKVEDNAQEYVEHCAPNYSVAVHDLDGTFIMAMWIEFYYRQGYLRQRIEKLGSTDGMGD